ncbi:MAG: GNAT family N-acetyltransferase [Alphaproteobacteria bacterium]|nr:GNAT family N-acetyltransferase [Alphaproteobacteria bacterium]
MSEVAPDQSISPSSPIIREARAADMDAVAAIDAAITAHPKPEYWQRAFRRYATRQGRYFLVAESAGTVRGFILGEERAWEFGSPPCGWIFAIGVDPSHREGGLGSRLFDAITTRMRAAGMTTVRTMLARDDALNMAFFRSQGMRGGSFIELEMPLAPPGDDTR